MDNYETEEFIREKVSPKLKEGEQIMWCGCTADGATPKERGHSVWELVFMAGWFAVITYALKECTTPAFIDSLTENTEAVSDKMMLIFTVVFLSLFYLAGLSMVIKYFIEKKRYYAVTNRRLYIMKKSGRIVRSNSLSNFSMASYKASDRGIGVIKLERIRSSGREKYLSIGGISDCEAVCDIFVSAIAASHFHDRRADFNIF